MNPRILRGVAVVLLVAGAVILVTASSPGIGFAVVAIGAALTVVAGKDERRGHRA